MHLADRPPVPIEKPRPGLAPITGGRGGRGGGAPPSPYTVLKHGGAEGRIRPGEGITASQGVAYAASTVLYRIAICTSLSHGQAQGLYLSQIDSTKHRGNPIRCRHTLGHRRSTDVTAFLFLSPRLARARYPAHAISNPSTQPSVQSSTRDHSQSQSESSHHTVDTVSLISDTIPADTDARPDTNTKTATSCSEQLVRHATVALLLLLLAASGLTDDADCPLRCLSTFSIKNSPAL